jgi:hypothetical protein
VFLVDCAPIPDARLVEGSALPQAVFYLKPTLE